jgi:hypothetical protein
VNAPDTRPPKIVEEQLMGQQANLEAALRWFNRQLGGADAARLTRLELRFPSRSEHRLEVGPTQQRVLDLCKDRRVFVPVSVRPHELALDNDMGHLTVRAHFNLPPGEPEGAPAKHWLARLRQLFAHEDTTEQPPAGPVDIPARQAADALLRGLQQAAEAFGRSQPQPAGGAGPAAGAAGVAVAQVQVTANAPELHRALAPRMPPQDTAGATLWIADQLRRLGLQPVPELVVSYRHAAPVSEHTQLVPDGQLQVRLLPPGVADSPADAHPAEGQQRDTPVPGPIPGNVTPLPLTERAPAASAPTVHLRLLGTWQGGALVPLPEPFECSLGPVPAMFSRSTLELKGFTQRPDAALARAASNSTPLHFSADGQGGTKLHAAHRPGSELAMYFFADGLAPCAGEHPLTGPLRLVVNGPAPLENGLFPLVIEVRQDNGVTR